MLGRPGSTYYIFIWHSGLAGRHLHAMPDTYAQQYMYIYLCKYNFSLFSIFFVYPKNCCGNKKNIYSITLQTASCKATNNRAQKVADKRQMKCEWAKNVESIGCRGFSMHIAF